MAVTSPTWQPAEDCVTRGLYYDDDDDVHMHCVGAMSRRTILYNGVLRLRLHVAGSGGGVTMRERVNRWTQRTLKGVRGWGRTAETLL
jgi:hypothetical protein